MAAPSGFTTLSGLRRAARAQKEIRGRVPAILSIPLALPPAEQKVTHASLCGQKRHQQRSANLISDYGHRERRDTSKKPMIYLAGVPAGPGISFRGRERGQLFDCNCGTLRNYVPTTCMCNCIDEDIIRQRNCSSSYTQTFTT